MMLKLEKLTLRELVAESAKAFGSQPFVSFTGDSAVSYSDLRPLIGMVQSRLSALGINKGDRVALLGPNMPNWAIAYLSVTSMGAVAVPVMPEFTAAEVGQVLRHSGAKVLIASGKQLERIQEEDTPELLHTLNMEELTSFEGFNPEEQSLTAEAREWLMGNAGEDDLAAIIYTSGTTGNSKGVMLTHRNLVFDAIKGFEVQPVDTNDVFLSILPLAHTYENTLGLILPMLGGARIYYLDKAPTPSVLLPAMELVSPTCMLSVPLVIEKVFKNSVYPKLTKSPVTGFLYRVSLFRKLLHLLAGKKLYKTFGGRLVFFGIGGSKLDATVERFLREARFPFAIGYGLTETSPLVAGGIGRKISFQSTGPAVSDVEVKLVETEPGTGKGEVWVKGDNVMKGYYQRPDLTAEVITPDGWFRTGDLGTFDRRGNLIINGRIKNLIIGANGKNIMPEEIESVINSFKHVVESLVVKQKGKLVALVHLNREELEARWKEFKSDAQETGKDVVRSAEENIASYLKDLQAYVNARVNKFSQVQMVIYQDQPFEKTATKKIKRFLYG